MRKLKTLILIMIFAFIGIVNVNAEEQYSIKVGFEDETDNSSIVMSIEGIDMEAVMNDNVSYYVKFVNDGDPKPEFAYGKLGESINDFNSIIVTEYNDSGVYENYISINDDWYMVNGYEKAYIVKCYEITAVACYISDEPVEVKKPTLPELSERYEIFMLSNETNTSGESKQKYILSAYPLFPYYGETGSHELNIKIGLIQDKELLKKLSTNEEGSLEELIEYAKKSDGKVFTRKDNEFVRIDVNDFEVIDGAYYYKYVYYTNTDGIYRNLDDITISVGDKHMLVNVVDGLNPNTKDELWEKFVEKYKKTGILDSFEDTYNFDIQSTENSLKIIYSNNEGISGETNFSYEDGILTYIPSKDESLKFLETLFVSNSIQAVVDLYGYDSKKIDAWVEQDRKLTLDNDGIEFEKVTKKEVDGDSFLQYDIFNSFKIDIRGFKSFESENKPEELKKNPSTATNLGYGILITILVTGILGYIYIKKQSKFPKHN